LMDGYLLLAACSARTSELLTLMLIRRLLGVAPRRSPANSYYHVISKTRRVYPARPKGRQVLECGARAPLFPSARGHSTRPYLPSFSKGRGWSVAATDFLLAAARGPPLKRSRSKSRRDS
jgi:hypothetical protein